MLTLVFFWNDPFMSSTQVPLVILGAADLAAETFNWIDHDEYRVVAFYDQFLHEENNLFGIPVSNTFEHVKGAEFLPAVGDTNLRSKYWHAALAAGLFPCRPIMAPGVSAGYGAIMQRGSIAFPNVVISSETYVGTGVTLLEGATVGHRSRIGDLSIVGDKAIVGAKVEIGEGVVVGRSCIIENGLKLGSGSIIARTSLVTKDVPQGMCVIGNPAKVLGS